MGREGERWWEHEAAPASQSDTQSEPAEAPGFQAQQREDVASDSPGLGLRVTATQAWDLSNTQCEQMTEGRQRGLCPCSNRAGPHSGRRADRGWRLALVSTFTLTLRPPSQTAGRQRWVCCSPHQAIFWYQQGVLQVNWIQILQIRGFAPMGRGPGGLQSLGWQSVRHDWVTALSLPIRLPSIHFRCQSKWVESQTPQLLSDLLQIRGSHDLFFLGYDICWSGS